MSDEPEEEIVDGLPVVAEMRAVEAAPPRVIPALQAAALAATGFLVGATAMAVAKRYGAHRLAPSAPAMPVGSARPPGSWPVGTSRTYLVNVRLIARSGEWPR